MIRSDIHTFLIRTHFIMNKSFVAIPTCFEDLKNCLNQILHFYKNLSLWEKCHSCSQCGQNVANISRTATATWVYNPIKWQRMQQVEGRFLLFSVTLQCFRSHFYGCTIVHLYNCNCRLKIEDCHLLSPPSLSPLFLCQQAPLSFCLDWMRTRFSRSPLFLMQRNAPLLSNAPLQYCIPAILHRGSSPSRKWKRSENL